MSNSIAIMQPYVFPYIGYFQLIHAVDIFVFYDDVNFIKRGWINRNKLWVNGREYLFSIPLQGASQNKLIHEIPLAWDDKWKTQLLQTVAEEYGKAPYFEMVFPMLQKLMGKTYDSIAQFAMASVREIAAYLGLQTLFEISSEKYAASKGMERADRLIAIAKESGCKQYINPTGGKDLYEKAYFSANGITLKFMKNSLLPYQRFDKKSEVGLSIIDVLMFNKVEKVITLLEEYSLE